MSESCSYCGTIIEEDDTCIEAEDGSVFCDEDCAHECGYEMCEHCGGWTDDYICPEDGSCNCYCSESCAESDDYFCCESCGNWHSRGTYDEHMHPVNVYGEEQTWCDSCRDDTYLCESCGDSFAHEDQMSYRNGEWYCNCCAEEMRSHQDLHEYGWAPWRLYFYDLSGRDESAAQTETPYLGVELETDQGYSIPGYCDELVSLPEFEERFWMTEDSSLEEGVEVTSHPMTLREHIGCGLWEDIAQVALDNGFKSHDAHTCGLHVHINRNFFGKCRTIQDAGGYKMMRLLQRFEHQFTVFSRRESNSWCRYKTCSGYSPKRDGNGKVVDTHSEFMSKVSNMSCERDHSQALNFQHERTFEFRIFRGTLRMETFFASLALVNGLAHVAKTHGSRYIENVSWYDLVDDVVEACDDGQARELLVEYLDSKELRNKTPNPKKAACASIAEINVSRNVGEAA